MSPSNRLAFWFVSKNYTQKRQPHIEEISMSMLSSSYRARIDVVVVVVGSRTYVVDILVLELHLCGANQ